MLYATYLAPSQLANALFMAEGALLVELAFAAPFAAHYAHAAAALGLLYVAQHVAPDERGVGVHNLTLADEAVEAVALSVERHLAAWSRPRALRDEL